MSLQWSKQMDSRKKVARQREVVVRFVSCDSSYRCLAKVLTHLPTSGFHSFTVVSKEALRRGKVVWMDDMLSTAAAAHRGHSNCCGLHLASRGRLLGFRLPSPVGDHLMV